MGNLRGIDKEEELKEKEKEVQNAFVKEALRTNKMLELSQKRIKNQITKDEIKLILVAIRVYLQAYKGKMRRNTGSEIIIESMKKLQEKLELMK